jgi:hypothetical protein
MKRSRLKKGSVRKRDRLVSATHPYPGILSWAGGKLMLATPEHDKIRKSATGWHKKLNEAQFYPYIENKKTGKFVQRMRYGEEPTDWGAGASRACGDCSAEPGMFHAFGCDVERDPTSADRDSQLLGSETAGNFGSTDKLLKAMDFIRRTKGLV